jgi:uncharacterized protein (TIGR03437 family)
MKNRGAWAAPGVLGLQRATTSLTLLCAVFFVIVQALFAAQYALTVTQISAISPEPSLVGQAYSVAFEVFAVLPAGAETPVQGAIGTATVTDGSTTCSITLTYSGSCSFIRNTSGVKTITVRYNGSVNYDGTIVYAASGAQASHTVSAAPPPSINSGPPSINSGGIVPVGSSVSTIQPGEWVSIYGTNLASSTVSWNGNFPTSLGGTSVTVNGKSAYLSFVSPGQVNLQAPNDTATGTVPVVVTTTGGNATSTVTLSPFGPSFLLLDAKHVAGIIVRSNGTGAYGGGTYDIIGPTGVSLGYRTVAAQARDTVALFAVGLGPTDPLVPAGRVFAGAAPTTNPVMLHINSVSVTPTFSGLAGAGLYQLNVAVPPGLGAGDVPLQANVAGVQTQSGVVISLR